jgi:hypothetical protein
VLGGGVVGGFLGSTAGSIVGGAKGASMGAPTGHERDAAIGAGVGAAIPFLGIFTSPLGAYVGTKANPGKGKRRK